MLFASGFTGEIILIEGFSSVLLGLTTVQVHVAKSVCYGTRTQEHGMVALQAKDGLVDFNKQFLSTVWPRMFTKHSMVNHTR